MQWENLTSREFARAVKKTGVCILPLGVVEKHGDHLPLGTDFLNGHKLACLAAAQEPAMVFPPFYFGQIYEARCFPGTITIKPTLLVELLTAVLDEIGRNGFKKIILLNAHGGNTHLLSFLAQCSLWQEKPYSVYFLRDGLGPERRKKWSAILESKEHGHACECETSISLANHPELVRMDALPRRPGAALRRLRKLPANFSGISWYANYPEHYAGDARTASAAKGKKLRALEVEALAEFIGQVKKDTVVPGLEREFFQRVKKITRRPTC
jgi:creatinine amidohydrolase